MEPGQLLKYFRAKKGEIVSSVREVVDIESPSFDEQASIRVADWIAERFQECVSGLATERTKAKEFGEHLVMRAFPGDGKPILILGHTDTVHPVGSTQKNPTREEDGRLYGCGTFDMKANIAVLAQVLEAMREFALFPKRPLTILLSCDEEVGSPTGRALVEREAQQAELCLVLEPSSEGKVKTGRKGTGMYRLKAHGVASHAGLDPEKGASAILELSRQVEKLHSMNHLSGGTTVNVCKMTGGTASNVIPEFAACEIDVRFATMDEAHRIEKEISELRAFDHRVKLELTGAINRPPMERTPQVIGLFEKARSLAAGFDYEIGETQVGGASDGNFVGALGVPVLDGLGVSGNGAHTLDEYVLVEDIPLRATLFTLLLTSE